jgi:GNAT superfamily N-acetyltransferase
VATQTARYSEQPALWDSIELLSSQIWPEYNLHGDVVNPCWARLYEVFPAWQFVLTDGEDGRVVAEGNTIPVHWDGTDEGLGPGIDATIAGGFAHHDSGGQPNALCALAAKILPAEQGRGLATSMLRAMAGLAREAGFGHLIAPVRPNLKERYPTIPIGRYAHWARDDGTPFDPWIRVHTRLGARLGPAIPRSMRISGTVADWESWTKMLFPETGDYVFPAGLAAVHIDREKDAGVYWEPNIWLIHPISG